MKTWEKNYLLLNATKGLFVDPAELTLSGENSLDAIGRIHPQLGNPFQYEFYKMLATDWHGDELVLLENFSGMREILVYDFKCSYFQFDRRLKREQRLTDEGDFINMTQFEEERSSREWQAFIDQYIMINYVTETYIPLSHDLFADLSYTMPFFASMVDDTLNDAKMHMAWHHFGVGKKSAVTSQNPLTGDTVCFEEDPFINWLRDQFHWEGDLG